MLAPRNKFHGFTLLELMIVIAVIAVLASVAYPSYLDSVRKARRADAQAALTNVQLEQQKLRSSCRFFGGTLGAASLGHGIAEWRAAAGPHTPFGLAQRRLLRAPAHRHAVC